MLMLLPLLLLLLHTRTMGIQHEWSVGRTAKHTGRFCHVPPLLINEKWFIRAYSLKQAVISEL